MPGETAVPGSVESNSPFLAEGGEMGERMRAFDWSHTALGPAKDWPQSLKTSVSICLNSRFAILVWWGRDLIKIYNDAYAQILGQKHPAALGAPGRDVWPEIWHIIAPMLEDVMERGQATWSDNLLLELDRRGYPEECYFTFSYSPIRDESGNVGGVFTPVQETTAQVIGERRLRTLRDLAESARAANARTSDDVCRVAARVLAANPYDIPFAAFYLFGETGNEARLSGTAGVPEGSALFPKFVQLRNSAWQFAGAAASGNMETVSLVRAGGEIPCGPWPVPPAEAVVLPIASPGLRIGFCIAAVSPRKKLDEDYRGFLSLMGGHVTTAVAEAHALEEERRHAQALAELDRAKTQFFSNVSHEFRTPLTLMLVPVEGMLARARGEEARELEMVHRNALRLQKLVNTLLDFSRIEAGRVQACLESTDLAMLTSDIASSFRSAMENAGLKLEIDCAPLSQPMFLDREMWEKMVLNLLSNALKYTFEGVVRVGLREQDGGAALTVADTGIGIEEADLPHIFERFHRVRQARGRTMEGTGIGLALIAELAKLHGGKIDVESRPGEGSIFTLWLPFGSPPEEAAASPTVAPGVAGSKAREFLGEALEWSSECESPGERGAPAEGLLLLADDNADMRDYLRRMLSDRYEVITVTNGAEALEAAHARTPDLILSDVMMPEIDGFELVRRLRASPETASVPVILLSARSGEESRVEGLDAGADDYLVKPFTARELRARVGTHLKLAQARKRAEAQATRILESVTDGFCALDRDFRFVYFNRAAEGILGASRKDTLGRIHWEVFPETAGTMLEAEFRRAARDVTAAEFECYWEQSQRWISWCAYPGDEGGLSIYFRDITEQKRAAGLIEAAQKELRLMADAAPVYLAHCDCDGRYLFVNRAFAQRFGLEVEEVIGKRIPEVLGEEAYARFRPYVEAALSGEAVEFEMEVPYQQLGKRYMHASYVPDRDAAGVVHGLVGAITDITAGKRIEEALRQREGQLQVLFDAAPVGIYMVDSQMRICQVNPKARPVFGDIQDLIGRDFIEVIRHLWKEDYAEEVIEHFRHTLETGEPYFAEERAEERRDRSGTEYYTWQLNRITMPDGEAGVVCYFYDVSASVLARRALGESEEQFRTLADNISQFAWMTDESGNVVWYNQRWYDYTGSNLDQMRGWGWMSVHHPDHLQGVVERLRRSFETGQDWEDTFPLRSRDGEYRWFLSRAQPIRDASGKILRWFGTNTDITGQLQTQEELRRANEALEQFAYCASHDLQEPLRQIAVYSQLLEKRYAASLQGGGMEYLAYLVDGAHRMEGLIHDLLAYSQAATGAEEKLGPVDVNQVLEGVTRDLETVIEQCGAVISWKDLPVVVGSPVPLSHVFQNLISNSLKYRSELAPRISVTAKEQGNAWVFAVQDNGMGIPKQFQTRVFGIFKRLHNRQQYPGTGMGLAICQKIVERYGGRIWVESEEGKGSTFFFTIPHRNHHE